MPLNCKNCIFEKCLMRTDKEFDICPVEEAKRKFDDNKENKK